MLHTYCNAEGNHERFIVIHMTQVRYSLTAPFYCYWYYRLHAFLYRTFRYKYIPLLMRITRILINRYIKYKKENVQLASQLYIPILGGVYMDKQNYMSRNFHYMLARCGITATALAENEDHRSPPHLRKNTILKFKDPIDISKVKPSTIRGMVQIFNERMNTSITTDDFKYKDLSKTLCQNDYEEQIERALIGDYIVLYLDPSGSGDVLGMFLRIEEHEQSHIVAHAIHKLRNPDSLVHIDIGNLFTGDIEKNLEQFRNQYQHKRKNSEYFFGNVNSVGYRATINLISANGMPQCQIFMDLKGYWEVKSTHIDGYRGGLGIAVTTNTRGSQCMRMGLVKKSLATKAFLSNRDRIREFLKTTAGSSNNTWYPLRLSKTLDSQWYNELMNNYENEESQSHLDKG